MMRDPDEYTASPQELVFRREVRRPLEDLVALLTGDESAARVHTYSELVQRAERLLAVERERIAPTREET